MEQIDSVFKEGSKVPDLPHDCMERRELEDWTAKVMQSASRPVSHRFGVIAGDPGAGTTTTVRRALQHLKAHDESEGVIYVNLDTMEHFWARLSDAIEYDGADELFHNWMHQNSE